MAKANFSNKLPPRDVIAMRIKAERRHIFQAQAICSITSLAARDIRDSVRLRRVNMTTDRVAPISLAPTATAPSIRFTGASWKS